MKELSIIICAYNNYKLNAKCLAHLFSSSYPKEKMQIFFIDNGSTDKTETLLTYLVEQGEPVIYLKQKENLGFVKGTNIGWRKSDTPFVMLLNNDAFVWHTTIQNMMSIITGDEKIGAVGAQELFMDNSPTKDKPYIFFKPKDLLDPELKSLEELKMQEGTPLFVDVDLVGSACAIIRKEALGSEDIFDERFHPAHYDQEDACMRIKLNGYRIVMPTNGCFFNHLIASTTSENLTYYMNVLRINKQKFLDKWLKIWEEKNDR